MGARTTIAVRTVPGAAPVLCALMLGLAMATAISANDYWVTKTTDDTGPCLPGDCSLRAAILATNSNPGDDTIYLGPGVHTLTIAGVGEDAGATGDLDITEGSWWVSIYGEGPGVSVVDAQGLDRVFHILPWANAIFKGITITGGGNVAQGGDGGGGIWCQGMNLDLENCEVADSTTGIGSDLYGGGINVSGDETYAVITRSTISNCAATAGGGGLAVRSPTAEGHAPNSTISGCSARYGGALYVVGTSNLYCATISGNSSPEGAPGVFNLGSMHLTHATLVQPTGIAFLNGLQGEVELTDTAIIGQCSNIGAYVTSGGNMESPGNTCHLGSSDLTNVADAFVEPLAWNGGPTMTHRFQATSVAVDFSGVGTSSGRDPRGVHRPQDGNGDGVPIFDIGALESIFGEIVIHTFASGFTTGWSVVVP
jgi:CSLREA domain-containing protein